jgi:transposase
MWIVGCDYHPSFQQIAWVDTESGECGERPLLYSTGEAERFYRDLKERGVKVRVGIEATGHSRWFERLDGMQVEVGSSAFVLRASYSETRTCGPQLSAEHSKSIWIGCLTTL